MKNNKALVLRCVRSDMSSSKVAGTGQVFHWPASGPVSCDDWNPDGIRGFGLHGWLWGEGDIYSCGYWDFVSNKWLVVEVERNDIIYLDGKVKFPKGTVVFCGQRNDAATYVSERAPNGRAVMFASVTAENDRVAITGFQGTSIAGVRGTAISGAWGTSSVKNLGNATAGFRGSASAGDSGTASVGEYGIARAGSNGKAFAGVAGSAIVGDGGIATAGEYGRASAGFGGTIMIEGWSSVFHRYLWMKGEVGIDGIRPNVPYHLDNVGKLVEAL